ncbi:hypothetical protein [Alicyclobacillus sendaiensis]|uniref:hypothetical protein n=1 Tax=Alicyclobacillus sendaiensis TaxID=192387 RepID=UPI0009FA15A6|nr:hypothetical protein [Alicyclobacillus sendaiensis]
MDRGTTGAECSVTPDLHPLVRILSPTFVIGQITVHQVAGASVMSLGNTWASDFRHQAHVQQGFGNVYGSRSIVANNQWSPSAGTPAREDRPTPWPKRWLRA